MKDGLYCACGDWRLDDHVSLTVKGRNKKGMGVEAAGRVDVLIEACEYSVLAMLGTSIGAKDVKMNMK